MTRVTGSLYALEVFGVLSIFALYRLTAKESFIEAWLSLWGVIFVGSVAAAIAAAWLLFGWYGDLRRTGSSKWWIGVTVNIVVAGLLVMAAEIAVRWCAVQTTYDEEVAGRTLLPRQWSKVAAAYGLVLDKAESQPTYLIADEELGWTVGPSRKSENELYFSSSEGLRSAAQGVSLNHKSPGCRIALIGDSFTFGESVRFEETWGEHLASRFGGRCQVLNFGVIGYGIDQIHFRYLRDVRPWRPDIVIFSFIEDDLRRTVSVYGFLTFPDGRFPFAKPRFHLKGDEIVQLPLGSASPRVLFAKSTIHDLPGINFDVGYRPLEWERSEWRWLSHSYLWRLLVTVYPLRDRERPEVSRHELLRLNKALIVKLTESIGREGARPLIVFFPDRDYLANGAGGGAGIRVLKEAQVPFVDMTACLKNLGPELFTADGHYSPTGNQQAAHCLSEHVQAVM